MNKKVMKLITALVKKHKGGRPQKKACIRDWHRADEKQKALLIQNAQNILGMPNG